VASRPALPWSISTAGLGEESKSRTGEHPSSGHLPKIITTEDYPNRQYFDPSHYRSVLFDQRGSGKSTPHASLEDNTTWHLVEDMEKLREHLGIDRWVVFGGSWGSTLSLAYAEAHPARCLGLILRGIFTLRREELLWFYQKGADFLFADFFDDYEAVIPEDERGDMMQAYYKRLTGDNEEERLRW
jgi:proline iminopeptidase